MTHLHSLEILPMDRGAAYQVAELEKRCFSVPWSRDSFLSELKNPLAVYRCAWLGNSLAGYAGLHHVVDEGYITNIAVAPEQRRRGIAEALLDELTRYALGQGLVLMSLEVRASNAPAIALYAKHGFAECGRRKGYYTHPAEDALIMTRGF